MSRSSLTAQRVARLALLAAAAVVLGYIEGLLCAVMLLPPASSWAWPTRCCSTPSICWGLAPPCC